MTEITDTNYEELILKSEKPSVLYLTANWCGPCRLMQPTIEKLAEERSENAFFGNVDVDQAQAVANYFGVRHIPAFLFIKGGKIVDTCVGAVPVERLSEKLDSLIKLH